MDLNSDNLVLDDNEILKNNSNILDILLIDRTTKKNIIFATSIYKRKGFNEKDYIKSEYVINKQSFIKSRMEKSKTEQLKRSKDMAEVFTPSWICNKQNNLIDNEWFGYVGAFNEENKDNTWIPTKKVDFKDKNWKDYVSDIRLEITCGEAPYLVSRYDAVTGEKIELLSRIGFFDRKMRVICENTSSDDEWIIESLNALKSIYGYEFQGDNLFIARKNLLISYIDYYLYHFNKLPDNELLINVAEIISWNLWQMDGLKMVIPYSCHNEKPKYFQTSLFGDDEEPKEELCFGCKNNDIHKHNGNYSYVMDWETNKKIKFVTIFRGGKVW